MADNTIDIVYRFIADTKQFDKELKDIEKSGQKVGSSVKAPEYKEMGISVTKANQQLKDMVKSGQLTSKEATKIRKEFAQARAEAFRLAQALNEVIKKRGQVAPGYSKGELGQLKQGAAQRGQGIYEYGGEYVPGEMEDFEDAMGRTFQRTKKGLVDLRTGMQASEGAVRQFSMEFQQGMHRGNQEMATLQANTKKSKASLEELGRALMVKGFSFYGLRLAGASVIQLGQTLSVVGGLATGGIFKAASDYVKNAESSNEVTQQWAMHMQSVEKSQARIGKVMAAETLPFLEKGAELLGRLANYIEKNPGAVNKIITGGLTLAGIGSLLMIAGKGINLISDTAFIIAAAQMAMSGKENILAAASMRFASKEMLVAGAAMNKSAEKNLLASAKSAIGGTNWKAIGTLGGTGTAVGGLAQAGILAVVVAAAAAATDKIFDVVQKRDMQFGDYVTEFKQLIAVDAKHLGDFLSGKSFNLVSPFGRRDTIKFDEDTGDTWFKKVATNLGLIKKPAEDASDSLAGLSDVLKNSLKRDEALEAYEDYKRDDLELVRKHYEDRKKIIENAEGDILKANENLAKGIAEAYRDQAKQISKATSDYNNDQAEAEQDYLEERADIIRDAGEEALEAERDLREKLRKLRLEYEQREAELLAQRDAVGLIKNRIKYNQDRAEAEREANLEIAQRRRELARKLEDLQRNYEQERAQRLEDFKERIAEIQQQTKEQVDELRRRHQEEMREIVANRNARLRELDVQLIEERRRRLLSFISQIRELDAALLGEAALRKQRQDEMLVELDNFLIKYRDGMGSLLASVPSKQIGGYVHGGLYKLHAGEFVLNPGTTSALEQMIGRKLTQSTIMQSVSGSRSQITWNDSRRFDSRLQASERRQITSDTMTLLGAVIG